MKKIRKNVFETNSSSVHSITISKDGFEPPDLNIRRRKVDGEFGNYIIVPLGYFGKDRCLYNTQEEKLSYLLTICYHCSSFYDRDDFMESWEFKELETEICNYVRQFKKCDGILIDERTIEDSGIDHQTLTDYSSVSDFCRYGMDYKTFVFNKYVALETDCD